MITRKKNSHDTYTQEPTAVSEFRPITCLNTIYKLITSLINVRILEHFRQNNILQLDQRGGVKGSMGRIDNLLIDKTVLEDASKFRKNLSCVWIDTKKAFDSVSHRWLALIQVLNLHRINSINISLIESIMRALEVITDQGPTHIGPITEVYRKGKSFCVQLFTMCLNPTAWYIRSTEGYSISKDKNRRVTHNLFVDDLKTYYKSQSKASLIWYQHRQRNVRRYWTFLGVTEMRSCTHKKGKIMPIQSFRLQAETISRS